MAHPHRLGVGLGLRAVTVVEMLAEMRAASDHDHLWGAGYREDRVPVIDGVATLADGYTVRSDRDVVIVPTPVPGLFVCGVCGLARNEPTPEDKIVSARLRRYVG